jgi:hypothetical protein
MNQMSGRISANLKNGRILKVDATIKEYLASKGEKDGPRILSRSDLVDILACPRKWRKCVDRGIETEDRPTPSTEFGSLLDCLLLQPHKFDEYYLMPPKTYETKKGEVKDWTWRSSTCRDWRTEQEESGHLVCTLEDRDKAAAAISDLMKDPEHGEQTARLLKNSRHQVFAMADYEDEETGVTVPIKILTDILPDQSDPQFGKSVFDLKTARNAIPGAWKKAVFDDGLHIQAAMGLDVINSLAGEDRCDFRHLIVENQPPFEPAYRFLTAEYIELGRLRYVTALRVYCQCVKSGKWPSYDEQGAMVLNDGYAACDVLPWMVGQ